MKATNWNIQGHVDLSNNSWNINNSLINNNYYYRCIPGLNFDFG